MKKSVISFCLFVGISSFFIGCQNEMDEVSSSGVQTKASSNVIESTTLAFSYKGQSYSSECQLIGDSTIILDENVRQVADQLALLPELVTYINPDGAIEYFDNQNQLKEYLSRSSRISEPYLDINAVKLIMYDDQYFKDRSLTFTEPIAVPQLKDSPYKFNDKMSSFIVDITHHELGSGRWRNSRVLVTFWEDDHFKNHSLSFLLYEDDSWLSNPQFPGAGLPASTNFRVDRMRAYSLYPGSSKDWNDKTTSFKLEIVSR